MDLLSGHCWLPICPEQLGGLPTPRAASRIVGGDGADVLAGRARVVDVHGRDNTAAFIKGARAAVRLAEEVSPAAALLRSRSPSCGPRIRVGSDAVPRPRGVSAAVLSAAGLRLLEVEETGLSEAVRRFLRALMSG